MALTPYQRRRIAWLKDGHFDDDSDFEDSAFQARWQQHFAAMATPEEMFLHVSEMHPACQPHEWQAILDHPLCDRGIAVLIYWRNSPAYYYGEEPAGGFDADGYSLIKQIEQRCSTGGFPSEVVKFDPRSFKGFSFLDNVSPETLARIPMPMRSPSPGEPVPPLADVDFDWADGEF